MTTRTRHKAALGPAAVTAAFLLLCALASCAFASAAASASAGTVAPLPPSDYAVRAACPPPVAGRAACLAQRLVPETAEARAHTHPLGVARALRRRSASPSAAEGVYDLTPEDLHLAYQLPLSTTASSTQTIALVDAYNDLSAEADLETYDHEFGLPECTAANNCFTKVNQDGQTGNPPFPESLESLESEEKLCGEGQQEACWQVQEAKGWSVEISLDIETAHAVCQNCHIALVEAESPSYEDLEAAEEAAVGLHATEISNSWAGPECTEEDGCVPDSPAFDHPGTVITAAAGDDGYLNWLEEPRTSAASFPASSPHVIAVGGTRLLLHAQTAAWKAEMVWNDGGEAEGGGKDGHGAGGGGCSVQFTAQPWQQSVADWSSVGCADKRAVADVSADADPYTGIAVYDSQSIGEEWGAVGGTSLASPLIASTFALAGGAHGVAYPARTLYENAADSPTSLHDVTVGSNGECLKPFDANTESTACTPAEEAKTSCHSTLICLAGPGYDGPSGVGTPDGIVAFQPPVGAPGGTGEPGSGGGKSPAPEGGGSGGSFGGSSSSGGSSGSGSTSSSPAPVITTPTPVTVRLSGLALTVNALIALNTSRPRLSELGFTFTINLATRVRASLAKLLDRRGHARWQPLTRSLTIAASDGRDSRHFSGHGVLRSGTYRLTLTPVGGTARSIVFKIG
jgi:hypothetical protein